MFFTTEKGVNVIQFGTGDIEIGGTHLVNDDKIGAVYLTPLKVPLEPNTVIDRTKEHTAKMTDGDLGVHTRLIFTDVRSIDALIHELNKAKEFML